MEGNVFLKGAKPSQHEVNPLVESGFDPALKLVEKADGVYLEMSLDKNWIGQRTRKLVTTELLGRASVPNLPYEAPDGQPLRLNTDFFGQQRNEANPMPGPFENPPAGPMGPLMRGALP
jgi:alpha-N-arabinofuranosidase